MKPVPLVSVVIPAYNARDYLHRTLDSVLVQEGVAFEVIVVDDGSADETAAITRSYGDPVRCIQRENGGVAEALNSGIAAATGSYIALLASDDVLRPGSLSARVRALDSFPGAAFVHTGAHEIDEADRVLRLRGKTAGEVQCQARDRAFLDILDGCDIICSSVMARREAIQATGGFNQAYMPGEDWAVWLHMAAHGDVAYIPRPLTSYRVHGASLIAQQSVEAYETAHQRILDDLFSGDALGPMVRWKHRAYAAHQRRMALTAAYERRRGKFLPYFLRSLGMSPAFLLERETWKTAYYGARLLVPDAVLTPLRQLAAR
jgi:glycosyltransferase involved in cell wall biosynthesis